MAIKYNYEIIEGLFTDSYLKINDYSINSQLQKENDEDQGVKIFICSCNIILMDMKKTKNITSINEIFKIENIDTFTLETAYKMINNKYPGDII
ncbi:MAG: hypothetical protein A2015_10670 [Spirochaetes bacterium GWF1_31_7]|nr:MAG: hypothetical protein A2Y29_00145 [Spirochaetes bacterium GWE2_31_10]OHD48164.1 MAG: hypothetical protein A2015_10670 [Spirochaetes bacterium GWF1_31_7]HBD93506.1 hypothetical protein [Spirochaetia bacterium]HBI37055.1 hypothetical protein [Spirochaetia bacterium]